MHNVSFGILYMNAEQINFQRITKTHKVRNEWQATSDKRLEPTAPAELGETSNALAHDVAQLARYVARDVGQLVLDVALAECLTYGHLGLASVRLIVSTSVPVLPAPSHNSQTQIIPLIWVHYTLSHLSFLLKKICILKPEFLKDGDNLITTRVLSSLLTQMYNTKPTMGILL